MTTLPRQAGAEIAVRLKAGRHGHPWTGWSFSAGWEAGNSCSSRWWNPSWWWKSASTSPVTPPADGGIPRAGTAPARTSPPAKSPPAAGRPLTRAAPGEGARGCFWSNRPHGDALGARDAVHDTDPDHHGITAIRADNAPSQIPLQQRALSLASRFKHRDTILALAHDLTIPLTNNPASPARRSLVAGEVRHAAGRRRIVD